MIGRRGVASAAIGSVRARAAAAAMCACLLGPIDTAAQAPAPAELPAYAIDPTHTFVHWEIVHGDTSTIRGRFTKPARGNVQFDAAAQRLEVGITIDTGSVDSGVAVLDKLLRGGDLLSTEVYPEAYFVATKATFDGAVPRELRGEFTLRGQSQPLSLKSTRWRCALSAIYRRTVCGGDFEGEILRSAFGATYGLPLVADRVKLLIEIEAIAP